jgi:plastocyanin
VRIHRLIFFLFTMGIIMSIMAVVVIAQQPQATNLTIAPEDVLVYQAHANHLQPCGAFEQARRLQTAVPAATNTPDPNAPTPAPTPTLLPAPSADHVGFPENYMTDFKLLYVFDRPDRRVVRIVCGNDIAAQQQDGKPFAYGSVLLMISYAAQLDGDGQPVLDENGHFIGTKLLTLHVMRKEAGFGEAYGEQRAGEWEFVLYNSDGSYQNPPETTNFCASCHSSEGGEAVDHVFRMNLFHEGESAHTFPPAYEDEISIYLYSFHNPVLEVKTGTTVTWVNNDQSIHTVVSAVLDDQGQIVAAEEPLFKSRLLASAATIEPNASFSYTFSEPGEYFYLCDTHATMTGKVIVTD